MAQIGDVYEALVVCVMQEQTSINTLHLSVVDHIGTGATDLDIAKQVDAIMGPVMKPLICSNAEYHGSSVRKVSPLPLGALISWQGQKGMGTAFATPMPRQVTGVITWKTALAGRSFRGRFYAPFATTQDINTGPKADPTAAYTAKLTAVGNALMPGFVAGVGGNTNSFKLVVWSKKLRVATPVSTFVSQGIFGTQRKRGGYGRPNLPPF